MNLQYVKMKIGAYFSFARNFWELVYLEAMCVLQSVFSGSKRQPCLRKGLEPKFEHFPQNFTQVDPKMLLQN